MEEGYSYDDILIKPKYSEIESDDINLETNLSKI